MDHFELIQLIHTNYIQKVKRIFNVFYL